MKFSLIAFTAAMLVCCSACSSFGPRLHLPEDPWAITFEKPHGLGRETSLNGTTSLVFRDIKENQALLKLRSTKGPTPIEMQWINAGESKYFTVGEKEYVFSVLELEENPEGQDKAVVEIASWETFSKLCRR